MPSSLPTPRPHRPTVGVLIRFKNAAVTLPEVLDALRRQTIQPDLVIGVNNGSDDASPELMRAAGARVIDWTQPYHHARVLNFGIQRCPADLVLVLSSHTVLRSADAIERLVDAMADPRVVCASGKWDGDGYYSDSIKWSELKAKGLKFCSIYSNSMGLLRRRCWEVLPFDESLPTMEDGAWAVEQVRRGGVCRRVELDFSYQRGGGARDYIFAVIAFQLAARHGLFVAWLGVRGAVRGMVRAWVRRITKDEPVGSGEAGRLGCQLWAWLLWRFVRPVRENRSARA